MGQHTAAFDASGGKIEQNNDPYLLQRGIQYRLHRQVLEENNNRQDLIAVQENFQSFESHVVQTIQQAMGSFLQYMGAQADRQKAMYADMTGTAQRIPPEFEWMNFLHRSGNLMIDPSAPKRTMSNISYPNQGHRSTQPLIAGTLERKSRALGGITGYKTAYYVVTPSKYLHQFDDDDSFRKDPTSDLSLYLPDCTVGALVDEKFNVKGKDVSKGKVGSAFQMSHEFTFKAHNPADGQKWWRIISEAAGASNITSDVPSPVTSRNPSDPPGYIEKNAPQLQTQGLPQGQGQVSAGSQSTISAKDVQSSGPRSAEPHSLAQQTTGVVPDSTATQDFAGRPGKDVAS